MKSNYLSLGELRKFIEETKYAPDNLPVTISLPVNYACCDENYNEEGHDPTMYHVASAARISLLGDASGLGGSADGWIPPEEREGEDWEFYVEIDVRPEEMHDIFAFKEGLCETEVDVEESEGEE